ncbi:MAG TPA: hypothetical protein PKG56_08805 [Chitinophagaceae bacterium]|nr:hypothetical protein [Chitinophagaceae bacterium]HMZ46515.1 hypothetical protein [Chitinophagaceae bacterium]HNJ59126.1 hypothetical protein [Chitinophagaceae bacterium]HNL83479.1 hypothetical protein [Chitinophagaceae bacterium]HNM34751.1 hypothetical protein [Chitinophagaceae bacterium]
MAATTTIRKLTPKQKLIAQLQKAGGIEANRKTLKALKAVFKNTNLKAETLRKAAWRMK